MDGGDALRFDTFDFRNIFEKDGRIYGYQGLKVILMLRDLYLGPFFFFFSFPLTGMFSNSLCVLGGKDLTPY